MDFGGSVFPPWCLDSGAWGGVQSHSQCPGLAWVKCQPFLEMGNRSDESLGDMGVSEGPKRLPGCRTEVPSGHGSALWLPGQPLLLGPVAQPPS